MAQDVGDGRIISLLSEELDLFKDLIAPQPGELVVLAGPTSAGKTTLLDQYRRYAGNNQIRSAEICGTRNNRRLPNFTEQGALCHYNTLDGFWEARLALNNSKVSAFAHYVRSFDFRCEDLWADVLAYSGPRRAVILLVDELRWWRRVGGRVDIFEGSGQHDYPSDLMLQLAQSVDLTIHYRQLMNGLQAEGIEFVAIDSASPDYKSVFDIEAYLSKVGLDRHQLKPDDISMFTRHSGFQDGSTMRHRIANAGKRPRQSEAISGPFEAIEEMAGLDFAGKSVLDTECGWGALCFEAERRGATRVVGIEPAPDRFAAACAMKRMLGSSVEFVFGDNNSIHITETFDLVLRTYGSVKFDPAWLTAKKTAS